MSKLIGGGQVKLYYGANNITPYFSAASFSRGNDLKDTTTLDDTAKEYTRGILNGTATLTGLYDDTATTIDAILNTAFAGSGVVMTIGPAKDTIGRVAYMLLAQKGSYKIPIRMEEIVGLEAEITADGPLDRGIWLHALGAETATVNSASVDNVSQSTNGGVAHLHVTATTVDTVTIKIQDSANDIAWADIATFTAVTGTTSERVVISGTIRQYTRCIISSYGTGASITYAAAVARR